MARQRYEITYYVADEDAPNKLRKGQYYTDDEDDAKRQANILKNDLGYFPVVVYDISRQNWVDF